MLPHSRECWPSLSTQADVTRRAVVLMNLGGPDSLEAVLDYPGLIFTFSYRPTPLTGFEHMGHIGCLFEGTEASLVAMARRFSGSRGRAEAEGASGRTIATGSISSPVSRST